jgi:general stress protein 26
MAAKSQRDSIKKLDSLIKGIRFAMLTTVCRDGSLRSRPMATQREDFRGTLWFFTSDRDAKVHEIEHDKHVNVSYADPDNNNYVSVSGRATLVKDKVIAKELWNPFYKAWFPKGLEDPRLALLRVSVEKAEYWDSPNSKLVQLGGFLKAVITGQQAKGGENEKVTIRKPPTPGKNSGTRRGKATPRAARRSKTRRPAARVGRR